MWWVESSLDQKISLKSKDQLSIYIPLTTPFGREVFEKTPGWIPKRKRCVTETEWLWAGWMVD